MDDTNKANESYKTDETNEINVYNHREIEPKWEKRWEEEKTFKAKDFDSKPKKYTLFEFPYPSGDKLHIGHAFAFTGTDVLARFFRAKGFNVLCPMGWDAFGLPAENYAIKKGINPAITTKENINYSKSQAKRWGLSIDWDREISTTDPDYYHWTQWIFLQWYKKGLAYKKEMPINWCPSCKIGLANEEVVSGKCERCGAEVTRRTIKQWVVKITDYADRLTEGLKNTDFIEKVKAAQINWIGRSEGAEIEFRIKNLESRIKVFTTRPDTLYGATFMVISPEHELVGKIGGIREIREYVEKAGKKSDLERTELNKEKTGVFSGLYAINPINQKEIPIWISDFVLSSYGTGAIMSVPAHDERDYAFAKKFGLPIIPVIEPDKTHKAYEAYEANESNWDFTEKPYTEVNEGIAINSPLWNGMKPGEAIKKATAWLEEKGIGKKSVSYHLRDWIFSRQHYWGEPIPMVFCAECGTVPVPEDQLPVELPQVEKYQPTDTGESPLSAISEWVNTACPHCGGPAKRETDTMPNWAGSDWYYLAYPIADKLKVQSSKFNPSTSLRTGVQSEQGNIFIDNIDLLKYWLPVDVYVGGDEHNTLHLLYSRFTYQFLWDIGVVPKEIPEPYFKRLSHGVILGPDGQRMSKSRGNVINPDDIVEAFGADALRMYLMFMGPFDYTMAWSQESMEGCYRFLKRVWRLGNGWENKGNRENKGGDYDQNLERKLNQTIKKVGEDIGNMKFNTAIAGMMELLNEIDKSHKPNEAYKTNKVFLEKFLLLLAPFAPHITEELWSRIGNNFSIYQQDWPEYDPDLIAEEVVTIAVQVNGKLRGTIEVEGEKWETQEFVEEMAKRDEKIKKYLEGQAIKKTIYIPGKLINFVI